MEHRIMDTAENISKRLKQAIEQTGISQTELAERTSYTRVYINQIVHAARGEYKKDTALKRIAQALDINPHWLIYGEGEIFSANLGYSKGQCFDLDDTFPVSIYNPEALGFDAANKLKWGKIINTIFIPKHVIKEQANDLRGLVVTAPNMSPSLCEGDLAIVDVSKRNVIDGRMYALMFDSKLTYRRMLVNIDGTFTLFSEYPVRSQVTVTANDLAKLHIVGEIVCKIASTV